jgi:7,8-dihydropterin-6-yl-methyl-4-(beta-D-ribofuranosyl)aminobenzene 5'-phosphate synthase
MIDIENISITTLSENSVADVGYMAEWGFSAHVDIQGGPTILFDTGNGLACTHNAEAAGIRLADIDMIVLSHGHADHTGGLRPVLQKINRDQPRKDGIDIFCHQAAIESQHVKHGDQYVFMGCPHHLEELEQLGANFRTGPDPVWICKDIVTSGEVPMTTEFESVAPICFLKTAQGYVNSPVDDDQALFLIIGKGNNSMLCM